MAAIALCSATLPNGFTVPYAETGDPAGPAVVLVHGYVESWRYFEPVLRALPESIHAYALTQRGHGDAARPSAGYTPPDLATDLVAFMDVVGLPAAALVGSSSGGVIAQVAACAARERVSRLILISSPASLATKPAVISAYEEIATLSDPLDRRFVERFVRGTSPEAVREDLLHDLVDESLKAPAETWKQTLRGLIEADLPVALENISAPTLLIVGEDDALVRDDQRELARRIPDAELVVYGGIGHTVHLAVPERVVRDIVRFVAPPASDAVARGSGL